MHSIFISLKLLILGSSHLIPNTIIRALCMPTVQSMDFHNLKDIFMPYITAIVYFLLVLLVILLEGIISKM